MKEQETQEPGLDGISLRDFTYTHTNTDAALHGGLPYYLTQWGGEEHNRVDPVSALILIVDLCCVSCSFSSPGKPRGRMEKIRTDENSKMSVVTVAYSPFLLSCSLCLSLSFPLPLSVSHKHMNTLASFSLLSISHH